MNPSLVTGLKSIKSPLSGDGRPNSICVSSNGIIVCLGDDGSIVYCSGRKHGVEETFSQVPISGGQEKFRSFFFSHLQFNPEGTLLLVWSNLHIGVIELPDRVGTDCCFYVVDQSLNNSKTTAPRQIVQCSFHTFSCNHVVALFRGSLEIFDLVLETSQKIPLNVEHSFVAFTFGPAIDWLSLSVLLLEASGDVFVLCPVIPIGALLPTPLLESMQDWVHLRRERNPDRSQSAYLDGVSMFLHSLGKEESPEGLLVVGGGHTHLTPLRHSSSSQSSWSNSLLLDSISFTSLACVQGPLRLATKFPSGRKRNIACDICVLKQRLDTSDNAAPVVLVSYANGTVDAFLLSVEDDYSVGLVGVGPRWLSPDRDCETMVVVPSMLLMEEIDVTRQTGINFTNKDKWMLSNDPVLPFSMHISAENHCASFLLTMNWVQSLCSAINGDNDSTESADLASNLKPSTMIPVYCPFGASSEKCPSLCAAAVLFDSVLGHFGIFKSSSDHVAIVNLTVHDKLCGIQMKLQNMSNLPKKSTVALEDQLADTQRLAFDDKMTELVRDAVVGLGTIPSFEEVALQTVVAAGGSDTVTSNVLVTKALFGACEHLKKGVVVPLFEMSQRLRYKIDSVQANFEAQVELLNGADNAASSGLIHGINQLNADYSNLANRIDVIGSKFETQKKRAEALLHAIAMLRTKMSDSERSHEKQLKVWAKEATQMEAALAALTLKINKHNKIFEAEDRHYNPQPEAGEPSSPLPVGGAGGRNVATPPGGQGKSGLQFGTSPRTKSLFRMSQPLYARRPTPNPNPSPNPNTDPRGTQPDQAKASTSPFQGFPQHLASDLQFKGGNVLGSTSPTPVAASSPLSPSHRLRTPSKLTPQRTESTTKSIGRTPSASFNEMELESIWRMQCQQTECLSEYTSIVRELEARVHKLKQRM